MATTETVTKPAAQTVAEAPTTTLLLRLVGRHWETPTLDDAGWFETVYELDPRETGFVALHLWNVGDAGGPPIPDRFFVDMGSRESQEESVRIAERYIRPAIDASRAAGLPIFHVEPPNIALKYPSVHHMLEPEDLEPPRRERPPEANPGWKKARAERSHGRGYAEWEGWQQMRILSSCDAEPGDQVILTSAQFDRICRARGIKNLVYTGFATNMCIMFAAGGAQDMLDYGYRIFLIREATHAVEYPDTFEERLMTRAALKYFELKLGDTIGFEQYVEAARAVADNGARSVSTT